MAKKTIKAFARQQIFGELSRFVGQAGHGQALRLKSLQALQHPRIDLGVLTVDTAIVVLVAQKGCLVHGVHGGVVTDQAAGLHLGQGELVLQHRAHQMLRAFADSDIDHAFVHLGQVDVGQSQIERGLEVGHGVDHGAIKVDHEGLQSWDIHR